MVAWGKVTNHAAYDVKIAINIARIQSAIVAEAKIADEVYHKLCLEHAVLTDKGEIAPGGKIRDEVLQVWLVKEKEFNATEFEIDRPLLDLLKVLEAKISPLDISVLEPVLKPMLEEVPAAG